MNLAIALGVLLPLSAGAAPAGPQPSVVPVLPNDIPWKPLSATQVVGGPVIHVLSGDPRKGPAVFLLKLPGEGELPRRQAASSYTAVVVSGTWMHTATGEPETEIPPGGYWKQPAKRPHAYRCRAGPDCVAVVHSRGPFVLAPARRAGMAKSGASEPPPPAR